MLFTRVRFTTPEETEKFTRQAIAQALAALPKDQRTVSEWINVDAGFNRVSAQQLASNLRTFSTRFNGIRQDGQNNLGRVDNRRSGQPQSYQQRNSERH